MQEKAEEIKEKADQIIKEARKLRDKHLSLFERIFYIFSFTLFICGLSILITGSIFASQDELNSSSDFVKLVKQFVILEFIAYFFLVSIFGFIGLKIVKNRKCSPLLIALLGIAVFFFGFIPMIATSSPILALKQAEEGDLQLMCLLNPKYVHDQGKYGPIEAFFLQLAQNFDFISEQLIDRNMCTDVCPCFSQISNNQTFSSLDPSLKTDPQYLYSLLDESYLLKHNRTWSKFTNQYIKRFVWSQNQSFSFLNFQDCLFYWQLQQIKNNSIDLGKIFSIDETSFKQIKNSLDISTQNLAKNLKNGYKPDSSYIGSIDISFASALQEQFQCTGICQSSLFYFSRNITEGPPTQTCLSSLKKEVEKVAFGFAVSTVLGGVNCLIIFLLHFGLYRRKGKYQKYQQDESELSSIKNEPAEDVNYRHQQLEDSSKEADLKEFQMQNKEQQIDIYNKQDVEK